MTYVSNGSDAVSLICQSSITNISTFVKGLQIFFVRKKSIRSNMNYRKEKRYMAVNNGSCHLNTIKYSLLYVKELRHI